MKWVSCAVFLAFFAILVWLLKTGYTLGNAQTSAIATPTYMLSVVSTLLTAVTVVLAVLGIGIGLIAAYTLREIKNEALRATNELANEVLSEKNIDQRLAKIIFRGMDLQNSQDSEAQDYTDSLSPLSKE